MKCWACIFLLSAAFPLLCVAGEEPSVGDLLKLDRAELLSAYEKAFGYSKPKGSAADLVRLADKLALTVKGFSERESSEDNMNPFGSVFEEACLAADSDQLDQLIVIYSRLKPDAFEKFNSLPNVALACIRRELQAIEKEEVRVDFSDEKIVPSEELSRAPEVLVNAWQLYQQVRLTYERDFPKPNAGEKMDAYGNQRSFYKSVEAALSGKLQSADSDLRKYVETGANCLDLHEIYDSAEIATLVMLVHERRFKDAIGASLAVANQNDHTGPTEQKLDAVIEVLRALKVDWEGIVAGMAVDSASKNWGAPEHCFRLLGSYGSDRAAMLVNQLARWSNGKTRTEAISAECAFVENSPSTGRCGEDTLGDVSSSDISRISKEQISKPVQIECLATVEKFATADCDEDLARDAINLFARTQSRSSIPALKQLLVHRSRRIVEIAHGVLCAMGEVQAPIPINPKPVVFQIFINDEPLATGLAVAWTVQGSDKTGGSVADVLPNGMIEMARKFFTDPSAPANKLLLESMLREEAANPPQFRIEIAPPYSLDSVTRVEITAHQMEIVLHNIADLNAPLPATTKLVIRQHKQEENPYDSFPEDMPTLEVPVAHSIVIPLIQDGDYDVAFRLPGAELWRGVATVGPNSQSTDAALKTGSEFRYKIISPTGAPWGGTLFKDGKEYTERMDFHTKSYRSLPCGNYVLHIPGSEEIKRAYRNDPDFVSGPDEIPFLGRDLPFVIMKGSPAVIDLGEIHLQSAGRN